MVKITKVIQKESEKGTFALLELAGDLEIVQSQNTLKFYATQRRCTIPCTLDVEVAKQFIGKEIPGTITRVECEPYDYVAPETDEVIELTYRWEYVPQNDQLSVSVPAMVNQSTI